MSWGTHPAGDSWTEKTGQTSLFCLCGLFTPHARRNAMSHKKHERKKELDRRRKRRQERLKDRIREAKAAKKS
ncbi:hypothetical protein JCM15519_24040 [Fundidesulfovibrio butyratiphilus]